MRLLLDTCTFLWLVGGGRPLSDAAGAAIQTASNDVLLSAISVWEVALKYRLGKLQLPESPERLIPARRRTRGIASLAFDEEAALQLLKLPPLHRDPFDRMLVSQAIAHGLAIVTPDPAVAQYPVRVIW